MADVCRGRGRADRGRTRGGAWRDRQRHSERRFSRDTAAGGSDSAARRVASRVDALSSGTVCQSGAVADSPRREVDAEVKVIDVDPKGVRVEGAAGEQRIESRTVLWAAGVAAAGFTRILLNRRGRELDRGGRVTVDTICNIPGHPEIFVIGDASLLNDARREAFAGCRSDRHAARKICREGDHEAYEGREVAPFKYFDKGSLAVIGRAQSCRAVRIIFAL